MIKFEANMLVLDSSHSKEDQEAINRFIEHVIKTTKEEQEKTYGKNG